MALPKRLEKLIGTIRVQSEIEQRLLNLMLKRLVTSLSTLESVLGDSGVEDGYRRTVNCLIKERSSACTDGFEEGVEQSLMESLRRLPSEAEDHLVGLLVDHILGITEALLAMAGVEMLEDQETEEEAGP